MLKEIKIDGEPDSLEGLIVPFNHNGHIEISQGYDGPYSHKAFEYLNNLLDFRFCVDFKKEAGTEITSPTNGRVSMYLDCFDEVYRGNDPQKGFKIRTNQIVIQRSDGIYVLMSHLEKGSVLVKHKQYVKQGETIARSGKSGWIGNTEHIHFQAFTFNGNDMSTLPVRFEDYIGPLRHADL